MFGWTFSWCAIVLESILLDILDLFELSDGTVIHCLLWIRSRDQASYHKMTFSTILLLFLSHPEYDHIWDVIYFSSTISKSMWGCKLLR